MDLKMGCDLVFIKRFKEAFAQSGEGFLHKIFLSEELKSGTSLESLAGYFALKEAIVKALGLKAGDWHMIRIFKLPSGKPDIEVFHAIAHAIVSKDVSISHDGEYVVAVSAFLLKKVSNDVN